VHELCKFGRNTQHIVSNSKGKEETYLNQKINLLLQTRTENDIMNMIVNKLEKENQQKRYQ
jgi:hypothetical protein